VAAVVAVVVVVVMVVVALRIPSPEFRLRPIRRPAWQ